MVDFTLFRIPIRVEPIFWLTLGIIGFLSVQGFPMDIALMGTALFVMAGFISILIHELGHALMIQKFKQPTAIVLSSFGGYATFPLGSLDRKQSFFVTLGGPALQAAFGLLIYYLAPHILTQSPLINLFIMFLYQVSIFWAVLNCIPVLPLDGGRMLEAILGPRKIKTTVTISMFAALAACIIGFTLKQTFLGIFMAMFAFQNYQALERLK